MSEQLHRGGKHDGSRKYQTINLSQHFNNKRDYKTAAKSTTGRGLQSLGKVSVSSRRLPRPAVCSSLKKENAGNDPNVALVPGSGGWASKKDSSSAQVENSDGEKGWKDVSDISTAEKDSTFSQDFPSLGEEEKSADKLELRPQTVKWGEKKPAKGIPYSNGPSELPVPPNAPPQHPTLIRQMPPQTFGVVQMPMSPMYGMVPVPGPAYPGIPNMYRTVYPANTNTQMFSGANTTGAIPMSYVYAPPPNFNKNPPSQNNSASTGTGTTQDTPIKRENKDTETDELTNGPSHWGDDEIVTPTLGNNKTLQKMPSAELIHPGYISPYTQPYPGKNSRAEASPRSDPEGKPSSRPDDKSVTTYYGRTSSHSSLSENVEDDGCPNDLVTDFEDKLDLNKQSSKQTSRIISRAIVKKELKAFPREEDIDASTPKTILQKPSEDHQSGSWEDQDVRVEDDRKRGSVWDERKKKLTVWNLNPDTSTTSNDRFFEDDYDPNEDAIQQRTAHVADIRDDKAEIRSISSDYDRSSTNYHDHKNNNNNGNNRRFMDSSMRKAIEETSNFISRISKSNQRSNITIKQKPVEILQKPGLDDCGSSNKPGTGNYWQDKQAERERKMEEEEREKREKERAQAQKARQDQYQDYRTPDQYGSRGSSRQRADDDRRSTRRRNYDEEYVYEPDVVTKHDRRGRYDSNKIHRYRDERSRSDYRDPRTQRKGGELREYERSRSDYRRYRDYYDDRYHRDYDRPPRRDRDRGKKHTKHESEESEVTSKKPEVFTEMEGREPPSSSTREQPLDKPRSRGDKHDNRERKERHYDRYEFTYRRDPRDRRPRESRDSRDSNRDARRNTADSFDSAFKPKSSDDVYESAPRQRKQKPNSRAKERVERYKAEQRKIKSEKPRRQYEEDEYYSSEEVLPRQNKPRNNKPPRKNTPATETSNRNPEKKGEQAPRRQRKVPSIRYYSANPADRKLNHSAPPASDRTKDKPAKERREVSEQPNKPVKDTKPKKEPVKKAETKAKPVESTSKSKDKDEQKKKKVEKTKLEMDRLKKMTQAGVDLLSIGIYAVDGKELDDFTDGFVEVVRKKSKKDPEIEKMEKKPSSKSKKSKKSDKNKKLINTGDNGEQSFSAKSNKAASATTPSASSPPTALKMWSTPDNGIGIMPNIWSNNNKQNAWDKPLSFNPDKPDTRDILAPLSGESSSLFSSEADLAKKTKEKDKYWKGDVKGPRFKSKSYKNEKKKSKDTYPPSEEETEKEGSESRDTHSISGLNLPGNQATGGPIIPSTVEDLFGLRSDGEEDKPTLSSLVLENKIPSPIGGKITAPSPAATTPIGGIPSRAQISVDEKISLDNTPETVQKSPDRSPDKSAETSTQTTPPVKTQDVEKPQPQIPSAPPQPSVPGGPSDVVTSPLDPVVDQLIPPTAGLSLTDQLRGIGQAQVVPQQQQSDRMQWMQGSLIQSLGTNVPFSNEPPSMTPPITHHPQQQQQPLLGHFMPSDMSHHLAHINSPGNSLIGSHSISSPLSTIGNLPSHRNTTTTDLLKSYISPVSPTNKMYPTGSFNQNMQQYMSGPFSSAVSPSMSPAPSQLFGQFPKSNSPKLQNMYGNNPNNMFESLDPSLVGHPSLINKPNQHSLNVANQHLFYQRMVPSADIFYKMNKQDRILLQSDMSKHVDAKPFNPASGMPMSAQGHFTPALMPPAAGMPPRPSSGFKPDLHQTTFLQHHPQPIMPSHMLPTSISTNPVVSSRTEHKPNESLLGLVRTPMNDVPGLNGILGQNSMHTAHNLFPHHQTVPLSRESITPALSQHQYPHSNLMRSQRAAPRVKLARDGRLHRVPDVRNKFSTLIPPSVQQHMQQQSLAQIQQYSASICDGTKDTLPDNMKPNASQKANNTNQQQQHQPPPQQTQPPKQNTPLQQKTANPITPRKAAMPPSKPVTQAPPLKAQLEVEETKIVDEKPVKEPVVTEFGKDTPSEVAPPVGSGGNNNNTGVGGEKKKTEKRKFSEVRKSYRRGGGGGGSWSNGNYGNHYYNDRSYQPSGYNGVYRGSRMPPHPPPPPPPPLYHRGYGPPMPPHHHPRDYRGPPPFHSHRSRPRY